MAPPTRTTTIVTKLLGQRRSHHSDDSSDMNATTTAGAILAGAEDEAEQHGEVFPSTFSSSPRQARPTVRGTTTTVRFEDVYQSQDDDVEQNFVLERVSGTTPTPAPDLTRQSRITTEEELSAYEEFTFDSAAEEKDDDEQLKQQQQRYSETRKTQHMSPVSEVHLRKVLRSYLNAYEPRAVTDGRLEKLLDWARQRGVPKLRVALREKYGVDLFEFEANLHAIPEIPGGVEKNSFRSKILGSIFGMRSSNRSLTKRQSGSPARQESV